MRQSHEISNSPIDFLVMMEGNISDAHEKVASVNFIILIMLFFKKAVSVFWHVSKQNSGYNLESVKIEPMR